MSSTPSYPSGRDTNMSEVAEDDPELALGESPCAQQFCFLWLFGMVVCLYIPVYLISMISAQGEVLCYSWTTYWLTVIFTLPFPCISV